MPRSTWHPVILSNDFQPFAGVTRFFTHAQGLPMTTDPFSASVIPFQAPEQMRALAEKGLSQARDSYAKFKDAAESHNGTIEAVFGSLGKGASEYSGKLLEFMQTNTTSAFDFAQELVAVKTLPEAGELWTGYTRKQFEALTAQAKELAELTRKIATDTAEPIKAGASKIFNTAA
jgi:phasin